MTNVLEIAAYIAAHVTRLVVVYALGATAAMTPLYQWAYQSGGSRALLAMSVVLSLVWTALTLPLFLVARGLFGGTPGRPRAIASSGPEIAAYALAHVAGTVALILFFSAILTPVYTALQRQGRSELSIAISFGLSLAVTAAMFAGFVYLRRAFSTARR